jgi:hypothetical protein
VHAPFGQDPRQYRERRDGHRHTDEQREREEGDRVAVHDRVRGVQQRGEQHAEGERQDDRRQRDRDGDPLAAADERQVDLEPDQEHEQHQPELGQDVQVGPDVGREELRVQITGQRAEQRRTQQDAGDDLPDHGRLADLESQPPEQPGDHHDHREVQEDVADDLGRGVVHE